MKILLLKYKSKYLTLKYELNDKQNLRLGASKTYTLPQFKERALFLYEEVLQVKIGGLELNKILHSLYIRVPVALKEKDRRLINKMGG